MCDRLKPLRANPGEGDTPLPLGLDKAGVAQDVEVVGERAWRTWDFASDVAYGDRARCTTVALTRLSIVRGFPTAAADALEHRETGGIGQCLEGL